MMSEDDQVKQEQEQVEEQVLEEDLRRSGLKESAINDEGITVISARKEAQDEEEPEEVVSVPSFFVDSEERHRVEVDILFDKKNGKIMAISRAELGVDFSSDNLSILGHTVEWFEFTIPNYDEMATYRQRCSIFNSQAGRLLQDGVQLRRFILAWHLKDWSVRDSKGNKIELKFNSEGSLSTESLNMVYKAMPILLDVVLTILEKDLLLI